MLWKSYLFMTCAFHAHCLWQRAESAKIPMIYEKMA